MLTQLSIVSSSRLTELLLDFKFPAVSSPACAARRVVLYMAGIPDKMDDLLALKQALFDEYDGFADKRYKKLDSNKLFMIDDRSPGDYGANGQLLFSVCPMFASVESAARVRVYLRGNVPQSQNVKKWSQKHKAKSAPKTLEFNVTPESIGMLDELALTIEGIVAAGGYKVPSYKYVCPRVANSLRRLAKVLRSL